MAARWRSRYLTNPNQIDSTDVSRATVSNLERQMSGQSIASLKITEILRPKSEGEPVNGHIVPAVHEPAPDYEAMRKLVGTPSYVPVLLDEQRIKSPASK
jgi:hypothetical protein